MTLAGSIKRILLSGLTLPGIPRLLAPLRKGQASIFMLHRFTIRDIGLVGENSEALRRSLAYLRRNHFELVGLKELFRRLSGEGPPVDGAVAFTLDDGYFDQADVAAPIFAEFDCPATTFVTTGFLDRRLWMWWDKIEVVFQSTRRSTIEVALDGKLLRYDLGSPPDPSKRSACQLDFTLKCKRVADDEKHAAIARLAAAAEIELPEQVSAKYAPMTWEQLRTAESRGMSFGPHTVTHPVLARATEGESAREIRESWNRLRQMARDPVPVFCYPNGQLSDFSERELSVLRELKFAGAVVGTYGHASVAAFAAPSGPFKVRRFGLPEDLPHVIQCVSGIERIKELIRGGQ